MKEYVDKSFEVISRALEKKTKTFRNPCEILGVVFRGIWRNIHSNDLIEYFEGFMDEFLKEYYIPREVAIKKIRGRIKKRGAEYVHIFDDEPFKDF